MTYLLTIDPGVSTGIVLGHYSDTDPWRRVAMWQVSGGIQGFLDWYESNRGWDNIWDFRVAEYHRDDVTTHVMERFTPLQHDTFALTSDSVEPLRIEGAAIALGIMPSDYSDPRWQRPAEMYFSGGDDLSTRKKASRAWLKSHNLLAVGSDVGQPDANDVISATLHSFAYMKNTLRHLPTLRKFFS